MLSTPTVRILTHNPVGLTNLIHSSKKAKLKNPALTGRLTIVPVPTISLTKLTHSHFKTD